MAKNTYRSLFNEGVVEADVEAAQMLVAFAERHTTARDSDSCRLNRQKKLTQSIEAYESANVAGKLVYLAGLYARRAINYMQADEIFIGP